MKRSQVKVLHLITELPVGGAQDNTLLSVKGLKAKGYHVDMAAAPGGAWEDLAKFYSDNLFFINAFAINAISIASNLEAIRECYNLIVKNNYDVVHTHSSTAGICGRIAAKLAGVPIIIHTVHGFPFHDFMPPLKKNFLVFLEKFTAGLCDHMITVSNLNLEEIVERKIDKRDHLTNIYSGINLDKFNIDKSNAEIKQGLSIPENYQVITKVARLSNQKAPQFYIEAAKMILKEKKDVVFLLVGDGPLKDELESLSADEPNIRMLGERLDIPEILKITDIFALSSIYEGLGRAMTEAMICRKPVVAPAVNGIPEVIKDGKTGFLIEPKNPDMLAEKLLILLNDKDKKHEIGENAYHQVVPAFSADKMVEDIDTLYCKIYQQKYNTTIMDEEKELVTL